MAMPGRSSWLCRADEAFRVGRGHVLVFAVGERTRHTTDPLQYAPPVVVWAADQRAPFPSLSMNWSGVGREFDITPTHALAHRVRVGAVDGVHLRETAGIEAAWISRPHQIYRFREAKRNRNGLPAASRSIFHRRRPPGRSRRDSAPTACPPDHPPPPPPPTPRHAPPDSNPHVGQGAHLPLRPVPPLTPRPRHRPPALCARVRVRACTDACVSATHPTYLSTFVSLSLCLSVCLRVSLCLCLAPFSVPLFVLSIFISVFRNSLFLTINSIPPSLRHALSRSLPHQAKRRHQVVHNLPPLTRPARIGTLTSAAACWQRHRTTAVSSDAIAGSARDATGNRFNRDAMGNRQDS